MLDHCARFISLLFGGTKVGVETTFQTLGLTHIDDRFVFINKTINTRELRNGLSDRFVVVCSHTDNAGMEMKKMS